MGQTYLGKNKMGHNIQVFQQNSLVNVLGFCLEDANTSAVEPIRAALAADVELRFIVGLPAQAVDLVVLFGAPALVTNVPAYRAVRLPTLRNNRS